MTQGFALALTLLVELPVLAGCLKFAPPSPPLARTLFVGALSSVLTHPLAWAASRYLAWQLDAEQIFHGWLLTEGVVTLVEAWVLRQGLRWSWRASLMVSLVCNTASAGVGLLVGGGILEA